jgi:hypothetical protein
MESEGFCLLTALDGQPSNAPSVEAHYGGRDDRPNGVVSLSGSQSARAPAGPDRLISASSTAVNGDDELRPAVARFSTALIEVDDGRKAKRLIMLS